MSQSTAERLTWLRAAVSLLLLLGIFQRIEEPSRTFEHLLSARFGFGALLVILALLELAYGAYRWLVLLRCRLPRLGLWPVLQVQFLSSFLGQLLPGGGMDLVKVYALNRITRDLAFSFTSLLMDRLIGLLPLLLVLLAGLSWESNLHLPSLQRLALSALALLVLGSVAVMTPGFRRFTDRLLRPAGEDRVRLRLGDMTRLAPRHHDQTGRTVAAVLSLGFARALEVIRDGLGKVYACLDTFRGRPGVLVYAGVLGIGANLLRVAVVMAAAASLGIHIRWTALLFIVPSVVFVMLLPISLAGWGVREVGLVWFLRMYGVPGEEALALSLMLGLVGVIVSLPGAPLVVTGLRQAHAAVRPESDAPG